jgi:hypothetical protein
MTIDSSLLRIVVTATMGALAVGCSSAQTASNVAPALGQSTAVHQLAAIPLELPSSTKCDHSRNLSVTPCHVTLTKRHPGAMVQLAGDFGTNLVQELDDCHGIAVIADFEGSTWTVSRRKMKNTCAAVFIYGADFAILTIVNKG